MIQTLRWAAWCGVSMFALVLLCQPVGVRDQLLLGTATILAMIAVWSFTSGFLSRQIFLALGSFVIIRYLYWRTTNTLPPVSDPVGFSFGLLLLAAEIYCVGFLAMTLLINADPLDRKPAPRDPDEDLPDVDVFVPSYNESPDLLAITLAAAKSMDYPAEKLTVWLLDDGGTDEKCFGPDAGKAGAARRRRATLQAMCADLGVNYLTRERNEHAKAGNMNNGLSHSRAGLVLVLDADHVPFRDLLRETVGHFARDPKLFLVQTPHIFLNPDPIERNLKTFERMPPENGMFYSITQRGLDKWNGAFFCGSAAVLRRAALEEAGGFHGITITEDCETAFELHSRGWTSLYVDKPLVAGLQPETFSSFITQRTRWCQGMMQLLLLKNPLFKRGLKFMQKVSYLSSMSFWFFPLPRLIFVLAPLLYIFFDVRIVVSNVDEALAYVATYIVVNVMLQNYLYGRVRWPWVSELYEFLQGVFLIRAMGSVMTNPRAPEFKVTRKGNTLEVDRLSALAWPIFVIYGVLLIAMGVAIYRYLFEPGVTALMIVVGSWNLFNLLLAGAALGAVAERRQGEPDPSLAINREAMLSVGGRSVPVVVEKVSASGCVVRRLVQGAPLELTPGETAGLLAVRTERPLGAQEQVPVVFAGMASGKRGSYELSLRMSEARQRFALADLMYGDASALARFVDAKTGHMDIFRGTARFVVWGVTEPIRALGYALRGRPVAQGVPHPPLPPAQRSPQVLPTLDAAQPAQSQA